MVLASPARKRPDGTGELSNECRAEAFFSVLSQIKRSPILPPMRGLSLLLIAGFLPFSGCSVLIARSGFDLQDLKSREQVHKEFGPPRTSETIDDGLAEHYRTRRKLSNELEATQFGIGFAMTFGIGEIYAFPYELYLVGSRTLLGQEFWVVYDSRGEVDYISFREIDDVPPGLGEIESSGQADDDDHDESSTIPSLEKDFGQ